MRHRKLVITSGLALAGGAVYRKMRRKRKAQEPDPADELRRKLDESRELAHERDEFESAEVPVDRAEPGIDERRRTVHERAQASIEDMRDASAE